MTGTNDSPGGGKQYDTEAVALPSAKKRAGFAEDKDVPPKLLESAQLALDDCMEEYADALEQDEGESSIRVTTKAPAKDE